MCAALVECKLHIAKLFMYVYDIYLLPTDQDKCSTRALWLCGLLLVLLQDIVT